MKAYIYIVFYFTSIDRTTVGGIVGGVTGGVILITLVTGMVFCCVCRKKPLQGEIIKRQS
jgi:hypothetical protein